MVGRYGGRTGPHRIAVAAALAASLIAPAAISAQEAEQPASGETPAASATVPAPAPDPAQVPATPAPSAPAATAAPAPAADPPAPAGEPASAVTVSRASASATKAVSIVNFDFSPATITVNSGDSVKWTNKDPAPEGHDVTGDGLDSGLMNQGDTYSFRFDSAGSYSYICTIHPSMTGTVEVLARSGGGGGSSADGDGSSGAGSSDAVTESEAVSSPGAAGTANSLPASGEPVGGLAVAALLLLALGVGLRLLPAARPRG